MNLAPPPPPSTFWGAEGEQREVWPSPAQELLLRATLMPDEIILPCEPEGVAGIAEWLADRLHAAGVAVGPQDPIADETTDIDPVEVIQRKTIVATADDDVGNIRHVPNDR